MNCPGVIYSGAVGNWEFAGPMRAITTAASPGHAESRPDFATPAAIQPDADCYNEFVACISTSRLRLDIARALGHHACGTVSID